MRNLCRLIWYALIGILRSRTATEAEILVLRHQLNILRRSCPKRATLSNIDRLLLVGLYRLAPGVLDALKIIRPATLLRWHRAYWRWKSRPLGGWPSVPADIPISLSANPFCHGDRGAIGRSRMPIARRRRHRVGRPSCLCRKLRFGRTGDEVRPVDVLTVGRFAGTALTH